jgi:SAM-dependent methyltransferase
MLVVAWTPEFQEAPEFRWLQAWVRAEAERVWDEVELAEGPPSDETGSELLIVGERCLLGRRSLAAMRRSISTGASASVPLKLASSGLPGLDRIRTLRGIERVEGMILSKADGEGASASPPHPAMLLAPEAASQLNGRSPAAILAGEGISLDPVTAGLCHEFIDYYGEVREDILPFLDAGCREVLEIGCGRGATGAFLQESLGCRVTGVELNPVVARSAAERLHRVVVGDVLEVDPGGPFDAVVACELFEHLTEGEVFLRRLQSWLRPGGRAVLSVPNVGHHAIVEDLVAGRWDYLPVGLLCSTHYRFFTRRSLEDTLRAAGVNVYEIVPQRTETPPWLEDLPEGMEVDAENLSTQGFYVVIRVP